MRTFTYTAQTPWRGLTTLYLQPLLIKFPLPCDVFVSLLFCTGFFFPTPKPLGSYFFVFFIIFLNSLLYIPNKVLWPISHQSDGAGETFMSFYIVTSKNILFTCIGSFEIPILTNTYVKKKKKEKYINNCFSL